VTNDPVLLSIFTLLQLEYRSLISVLIKALSYEDVHPDSIFDQKCEKNQQKRMFYVEICRNMCYAHQSRYLSFILIGVIVWKVALSMLQ